MTAPAAPPAPSASPASPAAGGARIRRRAGFGWIARLAAATGAAGTVAAVTCGLLALVAVFAPLLAPHSPNAVDVVNVFAGPSAGHLLGTDDVGRDLLSRLTYGARPSLAGPLLVTVASAFAGTVLGVLAAWCRGPVDALISRYPQQALYAVAVIVVAVVAVNLLGERLALHFELGDVT